MTVFELFVRSRLRPPTVTVFTEGMSAPKLCDHVPVNCVPEGTSDAGAATLISGAVSAIVTVTSSAVAFSWASVTAKMYVSVALSDPASCAYAAFCVNTRLPFSRLNCP